MGKSPKLTIELVPQQLWGVNLRSKLSRSQWDTIRKASYRLAGHRCEVCKGKGPKHPVECHEIWEYDDKKNVQTLKGVISLCPSCHEVKHMGRATAIGRYGEACEHLKRVNGWNGQELEKHVSDSMRKWQERSQTHRQWRCDIGEADSLYERSVEVLRA
jgi:hypothetical protein